jgi:alpha-N-arabinofuranosidase
MSARLRQLPSIRALVVLLTLLAAARASAEAPVHATVLAQRIGAPIDPDVYGLFIEHAGGLVYANMWAEMIWDRKFYSPIGEAVSDGFFGQQPRPWAAVGPAEAVTLDTAHAYAGVHSPSIALDTIEPHGLAQVLPPLVQGKRYFGRVVLAGPPGACATISVVWGAGPADRHTVTIDHLSPAFRKIPFTFKSPVSSTAGRIEITGTGSGALLVGAVSLMPSDNVQGWKPEVIEVLRSLRSGVYRWPGGNFVSAHDWRNAIGDPDRRPPILDPVWNAVQSNDIGTDEFMDLCRLTGVEPYISVNAGLGDAASAAEYVEYANGPVTSRMGALRARNGHPAPYHVRLWGIGNEMWGSWQAGYMPLADFEAKNNLFADEMRKVDPDIVLVASGAMPDTMTGSKESLRLGDKLIPDYLGPADWTGNLFLHCLDDMDMISEHFYNYDTHFDLSQAQQVPNDPNEPLVDWMRRPANHVKIKYEEYQEYLKRIPALRHKPVPIALDEYAYIAGGNTWKVAPAYAWTLHELFRHSELYRLGALTFITSMYSAAGGEAKLNTTGMLYKLYRDHFGTLPVAVAGDSPQPLPKDPPGGEQPVVNAGSDTYPLDVAAAWSADRRTLTIAVVNPTDSAQRLHLDVRDARLVGKGVLRRMAPPSLSATVEVGKEPGVQVEQRAVDAPRGDETLPPWSVSLYTFPAKAMGPGPGPGPRP